MTHSGLRLSVSFAASAAALALMLFLIMSAQIGMALMPVIGMGGFFMHMESFQGDQATVYPQLGDTYTDPTATNPPPNIGTTDTARCGRIPMVVFELQSATVDQYRMYKDIDLPFQAGFMTIALEQDQSGQALVANQVKMYTSMMQADLLEMRNVQILEGRGGSPPGSSTDPLLDWGPYSDEFLLKSDVGRHVSPDMIASGVDLWAHGLTATGAEFQTSGEPIHIQLWYNTTAEVRDRYKNQEGFLEMADRDREEYWSCTPPQGPPEHERYAVQGEYEFESWEGGYDNADSEEGTLTEWESTGDVEAVADGFYPDPYDPTPGQNYSARIGGDNSTLAHPSFDWSTARQVPMFYRVEEGDTEPPEETDYLVIEYRLPDGSWATMDRIAGGDPGSVTYNDPYVPDKALHADAKIRFRTEQGTADDSDYWHIDHIWIG